MEKHCQTFVRSLSYFLCFTPIKDNITQHSYIALARRGFAQYRQSADCTRANTGVGIFTQHPFEAIAR